MQTHESVRVLVLARVPFGIDDLGRDTDGRFSIRLIRRPETLGEAIDEYGPSVLLVDTEFPDGVGHDAISDALLQAPDLRVLALVPDPPPYEQVALATRAGASGFIDVASEPAEFATAILAVNGGDAWFPASQTETVLRSVAYDLDTTAAERRSQLAGVVLALVPLTGFIAAVQAGLWRRYLGRIGVRPVDLAVDPASRVIDAIVVLLFVMGVFGPLLFVGNWLDLLRESRLNRGLFAKFLGLRKTAHFVVSALWLVIAWLLAQGVDLGLVLIAGPAVAIAIIAKILNANSEIPRLIRIEGIRPGAAVAGSLLALMAFIGVLAYEVFIVGPDLRIDGEHGFLTPRVLGINAQPVSAVNVDTGESADLLYLGGNADLYVLVDPCDNGRVDMVSVGSHRLVVIDEIACPAASES
jgi:hypothetical protein